MDQLSRQQMCDVLGITPEQLRSMQEDDKDESFKTNENVTRIVMVGKTGAGKSATGNTILGGVHFKSKSSPKSLTVDCSKAEAMVGEQMVAVIDTPGLFDTRYGVDKTGKDIRQCISYACPGPHIFLVVIKLGRFTDEEAQSVQCIQEMFGPAADKYSMVLFTNGDQIDESIEDFLKESTELQDLVSRCNGQYHVFNNKSKDNAQVTKLLQKIRTIVARNGGHHYTNKMFKEAEKAIEMEKQRILAENEEKIHKEREKIRREFDSEFNNKLKEFTAQMEAKHERERKTFEKEMQKAMQGIQEEIARNRTMDLKKMYEDMEMNREKAKLQEMKENLAREREMDEYKRKLNEEMNTKSKNKLELLRKHTEEQARAQAESFNPITKVVGFFKKLFF